MFGLRLFIRIQVHIFRGNYCSLGNDILLFFIHLHTAVNVVFIKYLYQLRNMISAFTCWCFSSARTSIAGIDKNGISIFNCSLNRFASGDTIFDIDLAAELLLLVGHMRLYCHYYRHYYHHFLLRLQVFPWYRFHHPKYQTSQEL